jgi:hypothetical protein
VTRRRALAAALLTSVVAAAEAPFWETRPPARWTREEIETLLTLSPWGVITLDTNTPVFLASALPVREAEVQLRTRGASEGPAEARPGKHIVVATRVGDLAAFNESREVKQMEKESYLRAGSRKKIFAVGHFPPTPGDPYLRILFPRVPLEGIKTLNVLLYIPGNRGPFTEAEFKIKDLVYRGKVEY